MVELVDTQDLGSCAARREGSSPFSGTSKLFKPPQLKQAGMWSQLMKDAQPLEWASFMLRGSWVCRQQWAMWSGCQAEPHAVKSARKLRRAGWNWPSGRRPCRLRLP